MPAQTTGADPKAVRRVPDPGAADLRKRLRGLAAERRRCA